LIHAVSNRLQGSWLLERDEVAEVAKRPVWRWMSCMSDVERRAEADDSVEVADVAVAEDEAVAASVVADVVDVGSAPAGTPSMVRGREVPRPSLRR
jgi:hypothetical protein